MLFLYFDLFNEKQRKREQIRDINQEIAYRDHVSIKIILFYCILLS